MRFIIADEKLSQAENMRNLLKNAFPNDETEIYCEKNKVISDLLNNCGGVLFLHFSEKNCWGYELAAELKRLNIRVNVVFFADIPDFAADAFSVCATDYIVSPTEQRLYETIENLRYPVSKKHIFLQCFGNFEVFANGRLLRFSRSKAKEILAYLADRRGGSCTMGQLMSVLWEDGSDTTVRRSNLRNAISCLKQTLESVGGGDVIIKMRDSISLNVNAVECDYFDFINKKCSAVNLYRGEYMLQYSWAEPTAGTLQEDRLCQTHL